MRDGTETLYLASDAYTPGQERGLRPGTLPTPLCVGLGASWATLVAAELIAAQAGLGYRMQQAQIYYDLATVFVGVVTIGFLGLFMDRLLLWADTVLTSWQERR